MKSATRNTDPRPVPRIGVQPIAIGAVALALVLIGIGSIALWRAYTGNAPETDRAVAVRLLQARAAQASEQLVEKTKGLEATQQETIDQLQMVQDQLQTVRRQLASQQTDTKKLSEQIGTLTEAIEGLRQSFASAQANEPSAEFEYPQAVSDGQAARKPERPPQARQVERLSPASSTGPSEAPAGPPNGPGRTLSWRPAPEWANSLGRRPKAARLDVNWAGTAARRRCRSTPATRPITIFSATVNCFTYAGAI